MVMVLIVLISAFFVGVGLVTTWIGISVLGLVINFA